jgi:Fe-S-cluster containining protein
MWYLSSGRLRTARMKSKIKFTCIKCGACCGVGFIYLKKGEAEKIAGHLNMPLNQFKKKHTEWFLFLGRALKWKGSGACMFLNNKECSIYTARPSQCSTWPYWKRLLENRKDLNRAKEYCKGIST